MFDLVGEGSDAHQCLPRDDANYVTWPSLDEACLSRIPDAARERRSPDGRIALGAAGRARSRALQSGSQRSSLGAMNTLLAKIRSWFKTDKK